VETRLLHLSILDQAFKVCRMARSSFFLGHSYLVDPLVLQELCLILIPIRGLLGYFEPVQLDVGQSSCHQVAYFALNLVPVGPNSGSWILFSQTKLAFDGPG